MKKMDRFIKKYDLYLVLISYFMVIVGCIAFLISFFDIVFWGGTIYKHNDVKPETIDYIVFFMGIIIYIIIGLSYLFYRKRFKG